MNILWSVLEFHGPIFKFLFQTCCFRFKAIRASLNALKVAGVHGVAVEVWWGVVERFSPLSYDWFLYEHLFKLISDCGLKLHAALSFHSNMRSTFRGQEGVSLPQWILEVSLNWNGLDCWMNFYNLNAMKIKWYHTIHWWLRLVLTTEIYTIKIKRECPMMITLL